VPSNSTDSSVLPGTAGDPSVRIPVDVRRFPWIRRLAADYAYDFRSVAPFFSGDPTDRAAWADAIRRTQAHNRHREDIAAVIGAQQARRGAPPRSIEAGRQLADPQTVAILTGQQAGLFGGPLFTLLKALTALKLAEQVSRQHNVPAVAIFWIDAEDHDWNEVRSCTVFDEALVPRTVSLPPRGGSDPAPVATVRLDATITAVLDELEQVLPATEFRAGLIADLRHAYTPGAGMADAFGGWIERVLGDRGLIVFDSSDPAAKPIVSSVFARELSAPGETGRLAAASGADLVSRGYHSQVNTQDDGLALFHLEGGRRAIRQQDGRFVVGDESIPAARLVQQATEQPASFSPNVLLRPVVQDTLFPTICYVAGPNELAYLAQLRQVYAHFGVPMPLMYPRASATLLDSAALRFLDKYKLPLEALQPQDESALNQLLESQIPPSVEESFTNASRTIEMEMTRIVQAMPALDPTLEAAAKSTLGRMQHELHTLHGKMIQAAKRRDETLRRQYMRTCALAFPNGHAQERTIAFLSFLNQYGPALVDRLNEELPLDIGHHWIVAI
jgi:bacillithiol biosynthesis cysteine-adding enzyme BshC